MKKPDITEFIKTLFYLQELDKRCSKANKTFGINQSQTLYSYVKTEELTYQLIVKTDPVEDWMNKYSCRVYNKNIEEPILIFEKHTAVELLDDIKKELENNK